RLLGVDRSDGSLQMSERVLAAYAAALDRRLAGRVQVSAASSENGPQPQITHVCSDSEDILDKAYRWATGALWRRHDLNAAELHLDWEPNLIVASNVLNELNSEGRQNLESYLQSL